MKVNQIDSYTCNESRSQFYMPPEGDGLQIIEVNVDCDSTLPSKLTDD